MQRIDYGGLRCRLPISRPGKAADGRIVDYCMKSFNHVGQCDKDGNGMEPTKSPNKPEKLKGEPDL